MKNIAGDFWNYVELKKQKNKNAQKIYNWLNNDNLGAIVLDHDIFWLEKTCSTAKIPNFARSYIIKWASGLGYKYLYQ